MAFSSTIVAVYLPIVASRFTHSLTVIGVTPTGGRVSALFAPPTAERWSDRVRRRGGSRLRLVAWGTQVTAARLLTLGAALGGRAAARVPHECLAPPARTAPLHGGQTSNHQRGPSPTGPSGV